MTNRTCATCKAFLIDDGETIGSCQLHPPTITEDGCLFPAVSYLAWCLDWQSKAKAEKELSEGPKRGTIYPKDFVPNDRAQALAEGNGQNVAAMLAEFRDYHMAKGSIFKDWDAAFRTWLRNDRIFKEKRR